jgi:hypothetical protein
MSTCTAWLGELPGVDGSPAPVFVYSRNSEDALHVLPNKGQEAPLYLRYLLSSCAPKWS